MTTQNLTPFGWYKQAFDKFLSAKGRLSRRGYWCFALYNMFFIILSAIADVILHFTIQIDFIMTTYIMIFLFPSLTAGSRRLHDIGKSGWCQILLFVPVIGWYFLLKWLMQPSMMEDNKFGPYEP